ncbi:hypothetical protein [Nitrospira sp. BLG_2]|uniref:hypothetical protein n=1 Tax=Nitrospira sp. BLG_2 TaxID=3397507 RepID=UPI003B9C2A3A
MSCKEINNSRSRMVAVLLMIYSALSVGCAAPHVPSRIIYEDPVNFVRLEEDSEVLPEWPPSHHSHPFMIEPEKLRTILSGLKVQEHWIALQRWIRGESPLVPAFTDEELDLLSVRISEALAEARNNERVTFYLSQPQTFSRRIITTGGLYVHGTELHILLGNWRIIYGIPAYGMIYDRRYPMRPTAAKGFDLIFQPSQAVIPMKSSLLDGILANAKDELIIDLAKLDPPDPEVSLIRSCVTHESLC